jgi:hypothetical protein
MVSLGTGNISEPSGSDVRVEGSRQSSSHSDPNSMSAAWTEQTNTNTGPRSSDTAVSNGIPEASSDIDCGPEVYPGDWVRDMGEEGEPEPGDGEAGGPPREGGPTAGNTTQLVPPSIISY